MAFHAREQGATAILAMRFAHRVISSLWVEICAYGTAVVAVPRRRVPPARREAPAPPEPALYEATVTAEGSPQPSAVAAARAARSTAGPAVASPRGPRPPTPTPPP